MRDLQKYKQWLSIPAWQAWETFIANSAELDELSADPVQWTLPILVSAAITASLSRMQEQSEPMSVATADLVAKETTVPAKVTDNSYYYWVDSIIIP